MSTTHRRKRRTPTRPALVVLAGLLTTGAIAVFIFLAENAYNGVPLLNYRTVYVSLPNIGHLKQHDPVDIAGVRVGQVLRTSTRNNRALVELQLRGVGPLPDDSVAIVRAQGLLGERYVDLRPGKSHQMLPDGATLVEHGGTYTHGVPETLDLFDAKTRTALGQMMRGLGEGLLGRGTQLNRAIHVGPRSGHDFDVGVQAILARPHAAEHFFPALDGGFRALNTSREDLARMFAPAAVTAQAFVDKRTRVDRALEVVPHWFTTISTALGSDDVPAPGEGMRLWRAVNAFADAGNKVLPAVPAGLGSAATLLRRAAAPLHRTKPVLDEVPRAVPPVLRILASLRPDLTPLREAFTNLLGPVTELALHGCDLQNFATGTRSMVNFGSVPGGHYGPNVGFPVMVVAGPQEAHAVFNTHIPYPTENPYAKPCAYAPGPLIPGKTLMDVLGGLYK